MLRLLEEQQGVNQQRRKDGDDNKEHATGSMLGNSVHRGERNNDITADGDADAPGDPQDKSYEYQEQRQMVSSSNTDSGSKRETTTAVASSMQALFSVYNQHNYVLGTTTLKMSGNNFGSELPQYPFTNSSMLFQVPSALFWVTIFTLIPAISVALLLRQRQSTKNKRP